MANHPKQIGLPRLGVQATGFYRDCLEQIQQAVFGDKIACPLVETAVNYERINALLPDGFTRLDPLLANMFEDLDSAGATVLLIPNITLHVAIDRMDLPLATRLKLIHPIELGIEALVHDQANEIMLAGTRHTMQSGLLAHYFEEEGIKVNRPGPADMETLDRIRLEVFESGYSDNLKAQMQATLSAYSNIVIACTELSILNTDNDYLDLARLQIEEAVLHP